MPESQAVKEVAAEPDLVEKKKAVCRTALGTLFSVLNRCGLDQKTHPLALYASAALFVLGEGREDQKIGMGDIDICVEDNEGMRWLARVLMSHTEELGINSFRVSYGEKPPFLGNSDTHHLGCTIQVPGATESFELDIYGNFDKNGVVGGMYERVDAAHDIITPELAYEDHGEIKTARISMFKPEALIKIYRHLQMRQDQYGVFKPRLQSMRSLFELEKMEVKQGLEELDKIINEPIPERVKLGQEPMRVLAGGQKVSELPLAE